jgi:hypothetical protein
MMLPTMVLVVCFYKIYNELFLIKNIVLSLLEHTIRKRGRPPKPKPVGEPKRPQGRPKKSVDPNQSIQAPKPVGRPPRVPRHMFQPQVSIFKY